MKYLGHLACHCALRAAVALTAVLPAGAADDAMDWPPITSQTRPWVWWWWHGSAVDQTNIAHELRRFHDAGLGGVQITSIYGVKGETARDIPYLTPAWMAIMGYTVEAAKRLDLGVDMSLGSGWCFGGPTVDRDEANASVVVKTFDLATGETLAAKFSRSTTQALVAFSRDGKSIDLTDKISGGGAVDWAAPAGSWTVYAISQRPSGQKVKRAAPGGEGWMLNPLYPRAMLDWLNWFAVAFAKYSGPRPQAVFQDSYEYRTDWSPDFFAQFARLRGYKLQNELPALFEEEHGDHAARVKYDYRLTFSDILAAESEPAWIGWAHRNGFSTIFQAHGTPGNWLDLYADADMPETEMFHNNRSVLISKFASSAAHTQGRMFTGAETGTWLKEHFTETLADVKYLADDMFLAGVNHIYYHGACYSPDSAPWPGWVFYASTEMNPRNSIWHDVPALNNYVTRVQSVLQTGKSDNDVLLYWPVADFWSNPSGRILPMSVSSTDWFEQQPIGKTAHELWDRGYAFDYVADQQLETAKVVAGRIHMPGGDYKIIVVPKARFLPLETFRQLLALANSGATIYFKKLETWDVPGWGDLKERQAEFRELYKTMSSEIPSVDSAATIEIKRGRGLLILGGVDDTALAQAGVNRESMVDAGLSFVRRSFDGGRNYFIANRGNTNYDGWITPGRAAKSAVVMDPLTGNSGVACENAAGQIHLQLAAGESTILRTFDVTQVKGPAWHYRQTTGQPIEIRGNWALKFLEGGPALPAEFHPVKLVSWTTFPGTEAFAGTAKYEIIFDGPRGGHKSYFLDLGNVRQSARVKLNGKDYGTLFVSPFRVEVDNLKPSGNDLEVEVTNVSANRIRDLDRRGVSWKIFEDINIVNENYQPFDAASWPLTDSGLLGPVTLTAITPVTKVVQ